MNLPKDHRLNSRLTNLRWCVPYISSLYSDSYFWDLLLLKARKLKWCYITSHVQTYAEIIWTTDQKVWTSETSEFIEKSTEKSVAVTTLSMGQHLILGIQERYEIIMECGAITCNPTVAPKMWHTKCKNVPNNCYLMKCKIQYKLIDLSNRRD